MRVTRLDGAEGPLAARRRVSRERPDAVVAPLAGGAAGLLGRSAPLISLLAAPPAGGGGSRLRRWLERRQARGSVLLVAPERPVAAMRA